MKLALDLFFEGEENEAFARELATNLATEVRRLAPHITLDVDVRQAVHVAPWPIEWSGRQVRAFQHAPTAPGRQSLLITDRDIGAQGWGTRTCAVVSKPAIEKKKRNGGNPVDIAIHEWIHTLEGTVINGRPVPFADVAEKCGFAGETGPDGELRWDAWYRYCLGGPHS
jgi:hypothetical protein